MMVFGPYLLRIVPDDSLRFRASHPGHDTKSIHAATAHPTRAFPEHVQGPGGLILPPG